MRARVFLVMCWSGWVAVGCCLGQAGAVPAPTQAVSATTLVAQAVAALGSRDLPGAQQLADQAREMNAAEPALWMVYGMLADVRGDHAGAVVAYEKELTLHASAVEVYPLLVGSQLAIKRTADALASMGRWALAAPANSTPKLGRVNLLLEAGRNDEAAAEAATALEQLPGEPVARDRLRVMQGQAELRAGHKERGSEILIPLLERASRVDTVNDAAYALAEAGVGLPQAESRMQHVLDSMQQQTLSWTLADPVDKLLTGTVVLQSAWDTMGWIYFREGKLEAAEEYVRASWLGRQSEAVGQHLAAILAARRKKAEAAATLKLVASLGGIVSAQGTGTGSMGALDALRRLPLGKYPEAKAPDAAAEYKVLLGPLGLMLEQPTSEAEVALAPQILVRVKAASFFPAGVEARVVFVGVLSCRGAGCELVLKP